MTSSDEEKKKRSEKIITLFNTFKNQELKDLPVPPFTKWANGRIIKAEYGLLELEFEVRPEMSNPTNLLHGGIQCAFMDDVVGMTTATLGYKGFPISIDFHVDFLGKVKVGEQVRVIGEIIREGRNIIHANAEIRDMKNKLISTGNSNLLKTQFIPDYVKTADTLEN
ncbi:MAG: PaaI family thioesterase [Candidatus Hermodarchaeota archaeon]